MSLRRLLKWFAAGVGMKPHLDQSSSLFHLFTVSKSAFKTALLVVTVSVAE